MGKVDTLIEKLCKKPTSANFRYLDLNKVL